jgi:hypothetical protein
MERINIYIFTLHYQTTHFLRTALHQVWPQIITLSQIIPTVSILVTDNNNMILVQYPTLLAAVAQSVITLIINPISEKTTITGFHGDVKKKVVFWVVAPCSILAVCQLFGGPYCLRLQGRSEE